MKKTIRLTESDLHRVIRQSVRKIMNEGKFDGDYDNPLLTDDNGEYDQLADRLNEVNVMLNSIRNFVINITLDNPRVQKKKAEILQNIENLSSTFDAENPFIRACLSQTQNTWGWNYVKDKAVDGNKIPGASYWANRYMDSARKRSLYPSHENDDY